ncbi:phage holin family protein [Leptolyngbya sp. BL0902]|uniref:phage holin family protein n=1 Tax=Leptolyngbya sp. BL0902 TaxID=1115757 RepID=UPI0018E6DDFB|nr:phage holin family protein [Leptolyngbya sp. BL0902]
MASSESVLDRMEAYLGRIVRLFSVLVDLHLDVAVQEATYERQRLLGGVVLLSLGIGLFSMGLILLQGVAILGLHRLGWDWLESVATVAGVNGGLGILLLIVGQARLRGPVMVQTQARLARSVALLRAKS